MNKFLLFIIILLSFNFVAQAQTYNDGCMRMNVTSTWCWNEEYEDPFFNDESSWRWSVADNGNVDGAGYFNGGCQQQGGFFQIFWWNNPDRVLHNFSYGTFNSSNAATVPRYLNLRGEYEGDDSGGSCDQNTGFFVDDDDYRYNDLVSSFINYRFAAPNSNNSFQRFTTWHGSSDYGGEFTVNYSSPRPNVATTNLSTVCSDGSSGAVTLTASGAVFGGSYEWYAGPAFDYIGSGSSIVVDPLVDANGATSVVYHVYTKNGSLNSLCYKDISIDIVNCDFNCTSAQSSLVRTIPQYTNNYNYATVTTSGYPAGSYITDVNVSTSFIKYNPNNDIGFELIASASGASCTSTSLVNEQFTGNGQGNSVTSVLFDEQSNNSVASDPQFVSVMDPTDNISCYNWFNPNRNWNLRVDHSGTSLFQVREFEVEVCACKPPTSASITESSTNTITICETQGGTLELNVSGSLGAIDAGGFGDEVRWYEDVCYTGNLAGSGNPFTISAPTTPGTYTYYANYYVNGVACDIPSIAADECKSITIIVTEEPEAGAVVVGGLTTIDICEGSEPGLLELAGSNQSTAGISVDRWETSSDGGINWTPITHVSPLYSPGIINTIGTYYYRAVLTNAGCGDTYSDFFTVNVLETPIAGNTAMITSGNTYCSDTIFRMSTSGYAGALQWQISSNNGLNYADIPGQSSDDLTYLINNITELPVNYLFRVKASNAPCMESFSTPAEVITIYPATQGGLLSSDQDVCLNDFASDLELINVHGDSIIWEIDDNISFSSPTDLGHVQKIIGLDNTLTGATIGMLSSTQYVRARVINAYCTEAFSNTVTLTNYGPPSNSINANQSLCIGDVPNVLMGSLPTSGNGTYSYQWQSSPAGSGSWTNISGAISQNFDPVAYTVNTDFRRIVYSGPCDSVSTKVTVVYNINPSFTTVTPNDISCYDANDGSIAIVALNTDSFSIDGGMTYSLSSTFNNLTPGFYNVFIKNVHNCVTAHNLNPLEILEPLEISYTTMLVNPSCSNTSNGSITINASNGVGTLSYSLNGGGTQTGNTFSGLSAGNYSILISDANSCTDTGSVTLSNSYSLTLNVDSIINTSCFGQSDGALHLGTVGGGGSFMFSIDGANYQPDSVFSGLASGLYTVFVRDVNGCTASSSATIIDSPPLLVNLDSVNNVLCNGESTGAAYISVTGGSGMPSYLWSNAAITEDIENVPEGSYNVLVTSGGCSTSLNLTINEPTVLSANLVSVTNVSCNGGTNGLVDVSVSGGTTPYTYLWSNGDTIEDLFDVMAGTYTLTVTDANNCVSSVDAIVDESSTLTVLGAGTNSSCSNSNNGEVSANASGGNPPYTYSLNGGAFQTGNTFTSLSAGAYTITVKDVNGCTSNGSAIVLNSYMLNLDTSSVTNVSCAGQNDGQVQLTTVGGEAPFSFTVNGALAQSDSLFTGLSSGFYTFGVTDNNGCSSSFSVTISENAPMVLSLDSVNNVLCSGDLTGGVYVSVSGGDGSYTYSWTGAGTSSMEDLTSAGAGAYNLSVVDGAGCSATLSASISSPSALSANIVNVENVSCFNGSDGSIDVSISGGTPNYTFSWSDGSMVVGVLEDLSNVGVGNYELTITDANGCISTLTQAISQNPTLTVVGSGTNSSCSNSNNGEVSATVNGGQSPYTYSLNGGPFQTGNTFTGLSAGAYTISVMDANGCTSNGSAIVLNSYMLNLDTSSVTNVSCAGQNDGQVQLTTVGGEAPFSFTVNGALAQSDSLFTGLSSGFYTFGVTDNNGCSSLFSVTISENAPMVLSLDSVNNVLCSGDLTGGVYVSVSGGDGSYTYSWTGAGTSSMEDLTSAGAGAYNLSVVDGAGCSATLSASISSPSALSANIVNVENVSCFNGSNGSIDVSISGGTPNYTFSWSDGSIVVGVLEDLSNVGVGNYELTITDANGCISTLTQAISQNPTLTVVGSGTNSSCSNSSDGMVSVNVTGGQLPYLYSLNGGPTQNSNIFTGLSAAMYTISVSDANGCTSTGSALVLNDYTLDLDTSSVTNVSCAGQNDGQVQLTTVGGEAPFSFTVNGALAQLDSLFTGLSAGFYTFGVTDNNGCSSSTSVTILENAPMVLSLDSVNNVLCYGDATGAVYISVSGGDGSYTYSWTGAGTSVMEDLTGASAGVYNLSVIDGSGCSATLSANIQSPTELTATLGTVNNVSCNGGSDGSIDVSVTGGTTGYSFSWSDGVNIVGMSEDLSNVEAGVYTLTVTDNNNCIKTVMATITENTLMSVSTIDVNSSCSNANNGTITVNVTDGQAPYTYSINGAAFQSNNVFSGLTAGAYTINVLDAYNCTASTNTTLTDSYVLTLATSSLSNVSCSGQNDGQVQLTTSGGQSPFNFTINGASAQPDSLFTSLSAGFYTFGVLDANGCGANVSVNILENPPMVVSLDSITNLLCAGDANGAAYISVVGGDGSYTYSWTGAGTSAMEDLTNAVAGVYNLTVTDGAGCTAILSVTIQSPTALAVTLGTVHNVSCNGGSDGSIDVSVSGGTTGYNFSWSNGSTVVAISEDLSGVVSGTYTLTVTDNNGCIETAMATITENSLLSGTISSTDILCFGDEGSASVSVNGGVAPYEYLWSNFDTASMANSLDEGMISVVITDQLGCVLHLFDTIQSPLAAIEISAVVQNVTCFGLNDGSITETVTGGTLPYTITYSPGGVNMNLTAGVYTVNVLDANGCSVSKDYTISEPNQIMTSVSVTNPTCFGEQTGMAVAGATNGTAPYSYSWNTSPVQLGMVAVNLLGDVDYTLTITDANGCIAYDTAKIINPAELVLNTIPTSVSCLSNANGSVLVEAQGGNLPYEYQLNGFLQPDSVFDNLTAGNYVVFVTDNANCSSSASFTVSSASSMQAEIEAAGNDMNFVTDQLYVVNGEEVSLNVNFINDSGNTIVGYNWIPMDIDTIRNPTFMPTDNISVQVEVLEMINGNICSVFDTIQVNVSQESLIFIPTAFSPNNEGQNNFFEMNILGAENLNVQVFNRWGEVVFSNSTQGNGPNNMNDPSLTDGTNPRGAWDGKYKNEDVPTGSYAYKIEVTNFDGSTKLIKGSVTVIR